MSRRRCETASCSRSERAPGRELHDSLGHAVNVMVMQAGVGRHVFDEQPEFARQALEQVENVGRVALASSTRC